MKKKGQRKIEKKKRKVEKLKSLKANENEGATGGGFDGLFLKVMFRKMPMPNRKRLKRICPMACYCCNSNLQLFEIKNKKKHLKVF